jgi:hypothetical protein
MIGDTQLRYRTPKHQASGRRILGLTIPYFHSAMLSARLGGGNAINWLQDTAAKFRTARSQAFTAWAEVTGVAMAA